LAPPVDGAQPQQYPRVRSFIRRFSTNSQAAQIETDCGEYVIKAINNRDGPPVLVADWVGSMAARWLGLLVPDFSIVTLPDTVDVPLEAQGQLLATAGPCFGSKFVTSAGWDGDPDALGKVENPEMIPAVVIADTWLRNLDRFCRDEHGALRFNNPGNLLLRTDGASKGRFILSAIDFGYSLGGPSWTPRRLSEIGSTNDDTIYGCFPAFRHYMQRQWLGPVLERLETLTVEVARTFLADVPAEWGLRHDGSDAVVEFLVRRSRHVADKLGNMTWEDDTIWGAAGKA
jgi:hypothetical protein